MNSTLNGFFNIGEAWKANRAPTLDMKALLTTYEKNLNALGDSGKLAYTGVQEIIERQSENVRRNAQGWSTAWDGTGKAYNAEEMFAKSADLFKSVYQTMLADVWDVNEISTKATARSLGTINKRISESLDEVKTFFKPAPSGAKPATSAAKPTTSAAKPTTSGAKPAPSAAKPTTSGASGNAVAEKTSAASVR